MGTSFCSNLYSVAVKRSQFSIILFVILTKKFIIYQNIDFIFQFDVGDKTFIFKAIPTEHQGFAMLVGPPDQEPTPFGI